MLRRAVALTVLLAACGGDSDDEPGTSTFAGQMTGAYTANLTGEAVFGVTQNEDFKATGLAVILGDGGSARLVLVGTTTPKPPVGTYEMVPPDFPYGSDTVFTGTIGYTVGGTVEQFAIQGGSLTLTVSSFDRVSGSFELSAARTSPADSVPVFISGSFDAAQIPQEF